MTDEEIIRNLYIELCAASINKDIRIIIKDNKATVIEKTKTLASPFGMHKSWWRLRQDLELEKKEGKWIIKSSKASTY